METIGESPLEAMSALCRAAVVYEKLLVACLEARPELMNEVVRPHLDLITLAGKTVQHWKEYLELVD